MGGVSRGSLSDEHLTEGDNEGFDMQRRHSPYLMCGEKNSYNGYSRATHLMV